MARASSLFRLGLSTLLLVAPAAGCQVLLGIGGEEPLGEGGGGSGGAGGTTAATGGGGSGTSIGGSCTPDEVIDCYTGPEGTQGVGACKGGKATCSKEGMWGACVGEVLPAPESCASPEDESCDGLDCTTWVKTILGSVYGSTVGVDAKGNIVVGVVFTDGIDFGDGDPVVPVGNADIALLSYDKAGTLQWKKVFQGAAAQSIDALSVDADGNIAIGGSTYGDLDLGKGTLPAGAYVAKLDPSGNTLWSTSATVASGPVSVGYVALDTKGNVIAGANGGGVDLGTGLLMSDHAQSFWVAKLDKDSGQPAWVKVAKGGGGEYLLGLAVDSSDSPVLTGTWKGTYIGLSAAGENPPNDVFNNTGHDAVYLLRLDPSGNKSNAKMLAGQNMGFQGAPNGLDVDKFGWAAVVGNYYGTIQFSGGTSFDGANGAGFVARDQVTSFDQWAKNYASDTGYLGLSLVAIDGSDSIAAVGSYDGIVDVGGGDLPMGPGAFATKVDKDGVYQWSRAFAFGDGGIQGLAAGTLEDETLLVGSFYGSADLGTGVISAPQGYFIARLGK